MKYNKTNFYIFNGGLLLALFITISNSLNAPDFSLDLRKFLTYEDSRDLDEILNSYAFPVKKYWDEENVSKSDLEQLYKKAWDNVDYSKNYLLETKKTSNYDFILTTQFVYKLKNKSTESTIQSKLNFKLNNEGKIISIKNIELLEATGITNYKNTKNETNNFQTIRTFRYTLVSIFFIIILNIWWFISYRNFKQRVLIEEEQERLTKLKEEEDKQRQWLINTINIEGIEDEKDEEILKLMERLKASKFGDSIKDSVFEKGLVELIKKKHLSNIQQEKDRLARIERERFIKAEHERLDRIKKGRLAKEEKERLAKIEQEKQKEDSRLLKIQRDKENKRIEEIRLEKERLARIKKERLAKEERERLVKAEEENRRLIAEQKEKRLELPKKVNTRKSPAMDLSQYMGKIDENILNEEKLKGSENEKLKKYLTDFNKNK